MLSKLNNIYRKKAYATANLNSKKCSVEKIYTAPLSSSNVN